MPRRRADGETIARLKRLRPIDRHCQLLNRFTNAVPYMCAYTRMSNGKPFTITDRSGDPDQKGLKPI
jgi:hypothetical protein